MARQKESDWYVARINGDLEYKYTVKLDFLEPNKTYLLKLIENGKEMAKLIQHTRLVRSTDSIEQCYASKRL